MQGCEMNSNRLAAPVIFEDSSGCYPVCIKKPRHYGQYNGFYNKEVPVYHPGVMTHLCGLLPVALLTLKTFSAC